MKRSSLKWVWFVLLVLALGLTACGGPSKPTIRFNPISGQIMAGVEIPVQSVSSDAKGIARVEFSVDEILISESRIDPPQKMMTLQHPWRAEPGQHTLSVRAFNPDGASSDPAAMIVVVSGAPAPTQPAPTGAPTVAPVTITPVAGPTPTAAPGPCTTNSAFVKHVTVPDGTPWKIGQQFNKIWQVQNVGSCTWTSKYTLAFVSGEAMSNAQSIALPSNVAPGHLVDLLVPMNSPAAAGVHIGKWQLRDENNTFFGAVFSVNIVTLPNPPQASITAPGNGFQFTAGNVVRVNFQGTGNAELSSVSLYANGALLSKQTSRSSTRTISAGYDWQPGVGNYDLYAVTVDSYGQQTTSAHISGSITQPQCQASINFRADRTTINRGETTALRWDVDCVKAVYVDNQGVNGHDARNVAPASTTTYTLRVTKNDNGTDTRQVTIIVNQPAPTSVPAPTSAPAPTAVPATRRNINGNWISGEWEVRLNEAIGCTTECPISGELVHGVLPAPQSWPVSGNFSTYSGPVSFSVAIPGGHSFSGSVNSSSNQMCGNLSGVGNVCFSK